MKYSVIYNGDATYIGIYMGPRGVEVIGVGTGKENRPAIQELVELANKTAEQKDLQVLIDAKQGSESSSERG